VLAWEPPQRVTLGWHLGTEWKFDPDPAKASEVEIRFTAKSPSSTQVDLVHSKLERHGEGFEQLLVALRGPEAWSRILADFARVADRNAVL
jgi:hypothetical protein